MDYSRIVPPEITMETANDPPKMNSIIKLFFSIINKKWNKKQTSYSTKGNKSLLWAWANNNNWARK